MKTLIFSIALAFNLFLCFYPFEENLPDSAYLPQTESEEIVNERSDEETKSISYSDLLKNKATSLSQQTDKQQHRKSST